MPVSRQALSALDTETRMMALTEIASVFAGDSLLAKGLASPSTDALLSGLSVNS
jgi:hypothetical protein